GRDLAARLGLVPRQVTTGAKPRLVGISKRGNKYLRKLLIHGARAALPTLLEQSDLVGGMAARPDDENAQKRRRGRAGQQAGASGLGGAAARRDVPFRRLGGGIIRIGRLRNALIGLRCLRVVESEMA